MYVDVLTTLWARNFTRHLRRELPEPACAQTRELLPRIRRAAAEIVARKAVHAPDRAALRIAGFSALVLSAYRELCAIGCDRQASRDAVDRAFFNTNDLFFRLYGRAMVGSPDPVRSMSDAAAAGGLRHRLRQWMINWTFGKTFHFEEEYTPATADIFITRCGFNQFFVEEGEPSLTTIFCRADRSWMDVVNASSRPVRSERLSTISTGSDRCQFRLVRDEDKRGKPARDVILEQGATAAPDSAGARAEREAGRST